MNCIVAFLFLHVHYFLDPTFNPTIGILNETESYHAIKSLRLNTGVQIEIGDGCGNRYISLITAVSKSNVEVRIIKSEHTEILSPKLTIAIAPTKNPSRFEWFLEKATEMGVYKIIPMSTVRTERPRFKMDRAERLILAAAKQSKRIYIPDIHKLTALEEVLNRKAGAKFIAHCEPNDSPKNLVEELNSSDAEDFLILIGPEGDFTHQEIAAAINSGFRPVILGPNRLRTETAGVYAASAVYSLTKD